MQISKSDNVCDPYFYYKQKFFLFPFTCDGCGHEFVAEPGILVRNIPLNRPKHYCSRSTPHKYCRICSKDKENEILETLESWTDPKVIEWYEKIYGRKI